MAESTGVRATARRPPTWWTSLAAGWAVLVLVTAALHLQSPSAFRGPVLPGPPAPGFSDDGPAGPAFFGSLEGTDLQDAEKDLARPLSLPPEESHLFLPLAPGEPSPAQVLQVLAEQGGGGVAARGVRPLLQRWETSASRLELLQAGLALHLPPDLALEALRAPAAGGTDLERCAEVLAPRGSGRPSARPDWAPPLAGDMRLAGDRVAGALLDVAAREPSRLPTGSQARVVADLLRALAAERALQLELARQVLASLPVELRLRLAHAPPEPLGLGALDLVQAARRGRMSGTSRRPNPQGPGSLEEGGSPGVR